MSENNFPTVEELEQQKADLQAKLDAGTHEINEQGQVVEK